MQQEDRDHGPLVVTPLLSDAQISDAGVDVRLGNQFIVMRNRLFGMLDPSIGPDLSVQLPRYQEFVVVPFRSTCGFVLHPGRFVISSTFEYIALPGDLECQLEGRSSWARLGLVAAMATTVAPGFQGVITLEMTNLGSAPIVLHPGVRIAQLLFHTTSSPSEYAGRKYKFPIGPEFSKIHLDNELGFWAGQA